MSGVNGWVVTAFSEIRLMTRQEAWDEKQLGGGGSGARETQGAHAGGQLPAPSSSATQQVKLGPKGARG